MIIPSADKVKVFTVNEILFSWVRVILAGENFLFSVVREIIGERVVMSIVATKTKIQPANERQSVIDDHYFL